MLVRVYTVVCIFHSAPRRESSRARVSYFLLYKFIIEFIVLDEMIAVTCSCLLQIYTYNFIIIFTFSCLKYIYTCVQYKYTDMHASSLLKHRKSQPTHAVFRRRRRRLSFRDQRPRPYFTALNLQRMYPLGIFPLYNKLVYLTYIFSRK